MGPRRRDDEAYSDRFSSFICFFPFDSVSRMTYLRNLSGIIYPFSRDTAMRIVWRDHPSIDHRLGIPFFPLTIRRFPHTFLHISCMDERWLCKEQSLKVAKMKYLMVDYS